MPMYLYRRGNGNEGDYPRFVVELQPRDDAFAALRALVASDFIARHRARRHITQCIEVDGDPEHGVSAVVFDHPDIVCDIRDYAWLTAQLEPLRDGDVQYYRDNGTSIYRLREVLDGPALRQYRAEVRPRLP